MEFGQTYAMDPEAVPAEPWSAYSRRAQRDWKDLLADGTKEERDFQAFLEQNPAFVPGAFGGSMMSGHYPYHGAVISQAKLPGITSRHPDFMWIATDSEEISPVCIEIETPTKRWFTKAGQPTAPFTQARHQLTEWKKWFADSTNQDRFRKDYGLDRESIGKRLVPHYVLVYGRREEVEAKGVERSVSLCSDETIMTYDRISPRPDQSNLLCVKLLRARFRVVAFPPTVEIGPNIIEYWCSLEGIPEAIRRSVPMTPTRREFLLRRIPYWLEWCKHGKTGLTTTGDWE